MSAIPGHGFWAGICWGFDLLFRKWFGHDACLDCLVNVLEYWEVHPNGKVQYFSWITDFVLTPDNVYNIMRGGRARWKIENETFNTLKNQGYHMVHNDGHGEQHLSVVLMLMLAFLVDQTQQLCCPIFQAALEKLKSKRHLWEKILSHFIEFLFDSMTELLTFPWLPRTGCR